MSINLTLFGQAMLVHVLVVSVLTFVYGRRFSTSAGGSLFAIFAWLIPILGPMCFAMFLVGKRESGDGGVGVDRKTRA